jgi:protoporphyrinogen oxidase
VLEADPNQVGGISRTVEHNGSCSTSAATAFLQAEGGGGPLERDPADDFIERPRLSRIYYKGKFYAYPLKALEALRNLGIVESAACVLSYAAARLRPIERRRSTNGCATSSASVSSPSSFKTYTEKVWGMGCDEISADWAAQRIKGLDLRTAIIDGVRRSLGWGSAKPGDGTVVKDAIESFRYPRRGPGMMWEEAARKIRGFGGHVLMDRKVDGLTMTPNAPSGP